MIFNQKNFLNNKLVRNLNSSGVSDNPDVQPQLTCFQVFQYAFNIKKWQKNIIKNSNKNVKYYEIFNCTKSHFFNIKFIFIKKKHLSILQASTPENIRQVKKIISIVV